MFAIYLRLQFINQSIEQKAMKAILPVLLLCSSATFAQWNVTSNQNNAVCALQSAQGTPRILADDNGGAYIAWAEQRKEDRPTGVYIQHINAQGQILWGGGGVQVALNGGLQGEQILTGDGNGGFVGGEYTNGEAL